MNVPKAMQPKCDEIAAVIKKFSDEHLSPEYEELCLHALAKLARKRPSPLLGGRVNTWAAGIVYAIGSNNFIFDRSQPIHMTAKELAAGFGLAPSTASSKGAEIKKLLKIRHDRAEWCLPSMIDSNFALWLVEVNGLAMDARYLPLDLQILCHEKGLIPYVPGLKQENAEPEVPED